MKRILSLILLLLCPIFAQTEILTNAEIIEMSKAGLGQKVILEKTLSISKADEEFAFPVEGFPKSIQLDPKAYLLFK